eukprot:13900164-Ditylum_brightwellii.AAC.1
MGFIVDCNPMDDDDYYNQNGGSNDGTADGCARYVLWAAVSEMALIFTLASEKCQTTVNLI